MTKAEVIERAIQILEEKKAYLKAELTALNLSKSEDTKSSAGDKFETGREMIAQEISKIESQLYQTNQQQHSLLAIKDKKVTGTTIKLGSLIQLGKQWFLIAVSLGELTHEEEKIFLLSENSPLGKSLMGKKEKDQVPFRGKPHLIRKVIN